jgi:glycosyltransferase involved in cell wall biosynthesis
MVVLTFGVVDWYYLRQRPQQLARELAAHADVVYAHPRTPVATWRARTQLPPGAGAAWHRASGPADRSPWLYEPVLLPKRGGGLVARLNRGLFLSGLRHGLERRGLQPDWIWIGHPDQVDLVDAWPGVPVVYDCMDEWAEFPGAAGTATREERLLDRAALVFASSAPLLERLARRHRSVHLVPNGVEFDHFAQALERRRPGLVAGAPPIAITVGTFGSWVDYDLIAALARARPDWRFRLVGPVEVPPDSGAPAAPNLEWLGRRPYDEIPALLAEADVAFLPFRRDRLTTGVDPIKAYEFLAGGLPIVAPPLPELAKFGAGVRTAASPEEFVRELDAARSDAARPGARAALSAGVAGHSWSVRAALVVALLREAALPADN